MSIIEPIPAFALTPLIPFHRMFILENPSIRIMTY